MMKFYFSRGVSSGWLGSDIIGMVTETIEQQTNGAKETELGGQIDVGSAAPLKYKALSYDSTGLYRMPFRTSENIKVLFWQGEEDPDRVVFDHVFTRGLV